MRLQIYAWGMGSRTNPHMAMKQPAADNIARQAGRLSVSENGNSRKQMKRPRNGQAKWRNMRFFAAALDQSLLQSFGGEKMASFFFCMTCTDRRGSADDDSPVSCLLCSPETIGQHGELGLGLLLGEHRKRRPLSLSLSL